MSKPSAKQKRDGLVFVPPVPRNNRLCFWPITLRRRMFAPHCAPGGCSRKCPSHGQTFAFASKIRPVLTKKSQESRTGIHADLLSNGKPTLLYLAQCSQLQGKSVEQVGRHAFPRLLLRIQPATGIQLSQHESHIIRLLPPRAVSRACSPCPLSAVLAFPSCSFRPLSPWVSHAPPARVQDPLMVILPRFGVRAFSVLGVIALCALGFGRAARHGQSWRKMVQIGCRVIPFCYCCRAVVTRIRDGAPLKRSPCAPLTVLQLLASSLFRLFLLLLPLLGIPFFVQL